MKQFAIDIGMNTARLWQHIRERPGALPVLLAVWAWAMVMLAIAVTMRILG